MATPPIKNVPKFTFKAGTLLVCKVAIPNGRRTIAVGSEGKIATVNNKTLTATVTATGSVISQSFDQLQSNWKLK